MTDKQIAFVAEYLVDLNATQAAIRAGYSARTANEQACRLLTRPEIAEAIAAAMAKRSKETGIDASYVLRQAVKLHEACMEAKEHSAAARALELVGKHVAVQAFKERVEHGGRIEYSNLSDEEIDARIAALTATDNGSRVTSH